VKQKILNFATRKSFTAVVHYDISSEYSPTYSTIDFNKGSGILSIERSTHGSHHAVEYMEYNVRTRTVSVSSNNKSTRTEYDRNGFSRTYTPGNQDPEPVYVGRSEYKKMKSAFRDIVHEAYNGDKDGGEMLEGETHHLEKAKLIVDITIK